MNHEKTKDETTHENRQPDTAPKAPENAEEIENLPIESIGSYARIEEVMTDEDSEEGSNPTAQS